MSSGPVVIALAVSLGLGSVADAAAPVDRAWTWPLAPQPAVVRGFDPPDQPWGRGHRGVDLLPGASQTVRSPTVGTVTFSGSLAGRGVVVVAHPGGLRSTFEPVVDGPRVGTHVPQGGVVGTLRGRSHCAPVACLHWGVLRGDVYLDPLAFVGQRPVVLLPLG